MTQKEATDMATQLIDSYGGKAFEISMPDKQSYDLMRTTFSGLGRDSGPDGEFLIIKIAPIVSATAGASES